MGYVTHRLNDWFFIFSTLRYFLNLIKNVFSGSILLDQFSSLEKQNVFVLVEEPHQYDFNNHNWARQPLSTLKINFPTTWEVTPVKDKNVCNTNVFTTL